MYGTLFPHSLLSNSKTESTLRDHASNYISSQRPEVWKVVLQTVAAFFLKRPTGQPVVVSEPSSSISCRFTGVLELGEHGKKQCHSLTVWPSIHCSSLRLTCQTPGQGLPTYASGFTARAEPCRVLAVSRTTPFGAVLNWVPNSRGNPVTKGIFPGGTAPAAGHVLVGLPCTAARRDRDAMSERKLFASMDQGIS